MEVNKQTLTLSEKIDIYVDNLSKRDKDAFMIAKNHFGSSFSIKYSNGFRNFTPPIKPNTTKN